MKQQHTPGPWKTLKTFGGVTHVMTHDDKSIALLRGYKHPYSANARLIAAAPELLEQLMVAFEECEKAIELCGIPMNSAEWHQKTRDVIAKATGGDA